MRRRQTVSLGNGITLVRLCPRTRCAELEEGLVDTSRAAGNHECHERGEAWGLGSSQGAPNKKSPAGWVPTRD
jgi:hypothetical protein